MIDLSAGGEWQYKDAVQGTYRKFNDISGGGGLVSTSSWASPSTITTTITIPSDLMARLYIVGSGAVVDPTLGSGATDQVLYLMSTSNTNSVELNTASNLILTGKIIMKQYTILCLHWIAGLDKWVEESRNEK